MPAAKKPSKTASEKPKAPQPPREPMSPEAKARVRKVIFHSLAAIGFSAFCSTGFVVSQRYVDRVARTEQPPIVKLVDRPAWMTDALANQIIASVRPSTPFTANDHQMLVDRATILAANPWIKEVRSVRRAYENGPGDVIEIDCQYRAPVALVRWQDAYWYVDAEGVRLPERLSAQQVATLIRPNGQTQTFRIIDGVAQPPAAPGKPWPGGDVQAGIELIGLLSDPAYEDIGRDIVKIDVSNYGGRISPNQSQINLVTRDNTEVRWGQPPSSKAFFVEQPVGRKLDVLRQAKQRTGRVDLNQPWIDLRFDSATVPDKRASIDTGR